MEKKTPQEMEFKAWGLSKIAVRNIVVFFILTLLSGIGLLAKTVIVLNEEKAQVFNELLKCKDQGALKIEELKNENLQGVLKLNEVLQNQDKILEDLREAKKALQDVKKTVRK